MEMYVSGPKEFTSDREALFLIAVESCIKDLTQKLHYALFDPGDVRFAGTDSIYHRLVVEETAKELRKAGWFVGMQLRTPTDLVTRSEIALVMPGENALEIFQARREAWEPEYDFTGFGFTREELNERKKANEQKEGK